MPEIDPARSRADPAYFIENALADPETGSAYKLLLAEKDFLRHAFKTRPDGRLLYPEQVYGCPKKSGKTAFAAMHATTTTLLFSGRYPETIIVANSLEQSVGRVTDEDVAAAIIAVVGAVDLGAPMLCEDAQPNRSDDHAAKPG